MGNVFFLPEFSIIVCIIVEMRGSGEGWESNHEHEESCPTTPCDGKSSHWLWMLPTVSVIPRTCWVVKSLKRLENRRLCSRCGQAAQALAKWFWSFSSPFYEAGSVSSVLTWVCVDGGKSSPQMRLGYESSLRHILDVRSWACRVTPLSLNVLVLRVLVVTSSERPFWITPG